MLAEPLLGVIIALAGTLTLILGALALLLLQRSIRHNMAVRHAEQTPVAARRQACHPARVPLRLTLMAASEPLATPDPAAPILVRAASAHIFAGLVFAALATFLFLRSESIPFLPLRTAAYIWSEFWPATIALSLLVGPDRRLQTQIFAAYLGGFGIICVLAWLVGTQDLMFFGVNMPGFLTPLVVPVTGALPSLFLLLVLNRSIRTTGPLIFVVVFLLLLGALLGYSVLSTTWFVALPFAGRLVYILGGWITPIAALLGMGLAAWPAWRTMAWLGNRYAAKGSSELLITTGAVWLFQSLLLAADLNCGQDLLRATIVALIPLIAWRLALSLALRPIWVAANERPPSQFLFLRVFGFGHRSRRLLDLLGARCRLLGSINLIAAPDLASRTIEPSTFLEFVRGHLHDLFIANDNQLRARLAAIDHRPDPDARFRINQLFCSGDMWKEAVTRLMGDASLVIMDLRGFNPLRRGCVFEVQTLLDVVPLERLVFLIDMSTDRSALEQLVTRQWQQLAASSPNATAQDGTLRMLEVRGNEERAVRHLLATPAIQEAREPGPPQHSQTPNENVPCS